MELDQLNDDARDYYESDDGGYYEVTVPFYWNDRPKPDVPPHLWVDVVFPESFREAYSDELRNSDSEHHVDEEIARRLSGWLSDGYVCGVGGSDEIETVDELRDALNNDRITLIY